MAKPAIGVVALVAWVVTQGLWLGQAYQLEFEGENMFWPGLWSAAAAFFLVNCWILGIAVGDIAQPRKVEGSTSKKEVVSR